MTTDSGDARAYLYLVRHPQTQPNAAIPASQWRLNPAGRAQVFALLDAPFWARVTAVYTSDHYKAAVVGQLAAPRYGIPHHVLPGLAEAQRDRWAGREAFLEAQARFFAEPDRAPLPGWEHAAAARARFCAAVDDILARHPIHESLIVAAHATVLTLYYAHLRGAPPSLDFWHAKDFWHGIGFAAVQAVDRTTMQPVTGYLTAPYAGLPG